MENVTNEVEATVIEKLIAEKAQLEAKLAYQTQTANDYQDRYWAIGNQLNKVRGFVRNYFKDELDGDKEAIVRMNLVDINSLLTGIDAEEIKFTYSAKVTISFVIDGIEADCEDEAEEKIKDSINYTVQCNYDSLYDDEIEVSDVEAE